MPADLSGELPAFDPAAKKPNSTINAYDTDAKPVALPTWRPDEIPADARLARIAPAETNGEYTSLGQDGSNPHVLEDQAPAAHAESDVIHSSEVPTARRHPY